MLSRLTLSQAGDNTLETGIMDRRAVGWGVFSRRLQYPLQGSLVSPVLGILAILGGRTQFWIFQTAE